MEVSAPTRSRLSLWESAAAAEGNARTTTCSPGLSCGISSATWWRRRRVTRLRTTEGPTLRPTAKATRVIPSPGTTWITTQPRDIRRPRRTVATMSWWRRSRLAAGSIGLCRESSAALGPTARNNRATGSGAHPKPEAMRLRTTAVVRLERALHHRLRSRLVACGDKGAQLPNESVGKGENTHTVRTQSRFGQTAPLVPPQGGRPLARRSHANLFQSPGLTPTMGSLSTGWMRWLRDQSRLAMVATPPPVHNLWRTVWTLTLLGGGDGAGPGNGRPVAQDRRHP